MKDTLKRLFEIFLVCHFLITMVIGICGLFMGKDHILEYEAMFEPSIMALLCTLPALLTIRSEKLTMTQLVIRKILQVLIVEVIVLSMVYFGDYGTENIGEIIILVVAVFFVFVGVSVIDWIRGYMEAEELNRRLVQMRNK